MSKELICLMSFVLVLAVTGTASADQWEITVPDAGFDDHVLNNEGDWIYVGDSSYTGAWKSDSGTGSFIDYHYWDGDLPARSGSFKAYPSDAEAFDHIYQILDETFIEGGTYTLSVWVGNAWPEQGYADGWSLYFTGEDYRINLIEANGLALSGDWEQVSLVYTATAADAGKKIGIKMSGEQGESYITFEDVTLSYDGPPRPPIAANPAPEDGAMLDATWVSVSWKPADSAVSHDVYMAENFDDVNDRAAAAFQGNQTSTSIIVGFIGFPFPDGLVPGTTYYWAIDEVEGDGTTKHKGPVWSFWIQSKSAYDPSPSDGGQYVDPDVTLGWTPGFGAKLHTVYFSDSFEDVNNATGGAPMAGTTFAPGTLELDKTYYWRVDELDPPTTVVKGDVWSFTTLPDVPITDPDLIGWWTFDEGGGNIAIDWSGHGNNGTVAGDPEWVDGIMKGALDLTSDYVAIDGVVDDITSTNITLSIWINGTQTNQGDLIAANDSGSGHPLEFYIESGRPGRYDGGDTTYTNAPVVADGRWHMMTYVREGNTGRIYVDGVLVATDPATFELSTIMRWSIGQEWDDSTPSNFYIGLVDDVRFYNKSLTVEEIAVVMRGDTKLAASPMPDIGAIVDIRDISSLSWSKGDTAVSRDVYFGTDRDAVAGADNSAAEFQGNQAGTSLSLAGLVEFGGGDYYWRVDEVTADGTVTVGTIWKFTVPDYLIVDDFESYNDIDEGQPGSNRIYLTWIDGFGNATNGSQAGNLDPPFMSQGRSGAQAMPLSYDNAGKTSEATMTLASKKDWTEHGVTKLSIWYRGDYANAPDRMFVALGNAVVYHPDDAATQNTGWNEWVIDLSEFANQGTDLANVPSTTLGFGTRGAPVPTGGTGTVHFDDIELIR
ncbi:MAG: LamG domain-containing protein [Phycisphaerae bacterium]|nr:LamG domain-containing protein [Phycisphaerae bacterium]